MSRSKIIEMSQAPLDSWGAYKSPREEFLRIHGRDLNSFHNQDGNQRYVDRGFHPEHQYGTNLKLTELHKETNNSFNYHSRTYNNYHKGLKRANSQYRYYADDYSSKRLHCSSSPPSKSGYLSGPSRHSRTYRNASKTYSTRKEYPISGFKKLTPPSIVKKYDNIRRERHSGSDTSKTYKIKNGSVGDSSTEEKENKDMSRSPTVSNDSIRENTPDFDQISKDEEALKIDFRNESTNGDVEKELSRVTMRNKDSDEFETKAENQTESIQSLTNPLSPISDTMSEITEDPLDVYKLLEMTPSVQLQDLKHLLGDEFEPDKTFFDLQLFPHFNKRKRRIPKRGCGVRTSTKKPLKSINSMDNSFSETKESNSAIEKQNRHVNATIKPKNNPDSITKISQNVVPNSRMNPKIKTTPKDLEVWFDLSFKSERSYGIKTTEKPSNSSKPSSIVSPTKSDSSSSSNLLVDLNEAVQKTHDRKLKAVMESVKEMLERQESVESTHNKSYCEEHENGYDSGQSEVFSFPLTSKKCSFSERQWKNSQAEEFSPKAAAINSRHLEKLSTLHITETVGYTSPNSNYRTPTQMKSYGNCNNTGRDTIRCSSPNVVLSPNSSSKFVTPLSPQGFAETRSSLTHMKPPARKEQFIKDGIMQKSPSDLTPPTHAISSRESKDKHCPVQLSSPVSSLVPPANSLVPPAKSR